MVRKPPPPRKGGAWPTVNRIAQANVLIGICLAIMLRLATSWQRDREAGESAIPISEFVFFIGVGLVGVVGMVICGAQINDLRRRWQRVTAGIVTVLAQFTLFQVLMAYIG